MMGNTIGTKIDISEQELEEIKLKAFHNFMEMFIKPEINERINRGELPKTFSLQQAQIVTYPDGSNEIRLNDEVKAIVKVKLKDGIKKGRGDLVLEDDVEKYGRIYLPPEIDPNAGHMTFIQFQNQWLFSFDFIYNKNFCNKNIETAKQFLAAAEFSFKKQNWSAFIDNLFSVSELIAKTLLLTHSPQEFQDKANHKHIKTRFNLYAKLGNVDENVRNTFNRLSELRNPARYVKKDLELNETEATQMLAIMTTFVEDASAFVNIQ